MRLRAFVTGMTATLAMGVVTLDAPHLAEGALAWNVLAEVAAVAENADAAWWHAALAVRPAGDSVPTTDDAPFGADGPDVDDDGFGAD